MSSLNQLLILIAQVERELAEYEEKGDAGVVRSLEMELGRLEESLEVYDNERGYWRDEE